LISRRSRIDKDQGYRRVNIQAAFHNIGNVRLIMPGETFSAYQELNGNPGDGGEHFVAGYAIVGGGINKVYGG
jgi:vancomycin resistance protein YoaR